MLAVDLFQDSIPLNGGDEVIGLYMHGRFTIPNPSNRDEYQINRHCIGQQNARRGE